MVQNNLKKIFLLTILLAIFNRGFSAEVIDKESVQDHEQIEVEKQSLKVLLTNNTLMTNQTEDATYPVAPMIPMSAKVEGEELKGDSRFWVSYFKSFSIIFVSEIADKSFIMVLYFTIASKKIHPIIIFLVSAFALILMCILSVAVGYAMPLLLNKSLLEWIAILVFSLFGIFTIYQGTKMKYDDTVIKKVKHAAEKGIENSESEEEGIDNKNNQNNQVADNEMNLHLIPKDNKNDKGKITI